MKLFTVLQVILFSVQFGLIVTLLFMLKNVLKMSRKVQKEIEFINQSEDFEIPDEMDYTLDIGVYHFELESGQEN